MGRFYDINVSGATGGLAGFSGWKSQQSGADDPGALDIEFDIPVTAFSTPISMPFLRIWGIDIHTISQASNFNGAIIKMNGGMSKGLPLANPAQQGLIAQGMVYQAFGNWIGSDMTLDLQIVADGSTNQKGQPTNLNIVVNWKKGSKLSDALTNTLQTAYPGYTVNANIDPTLVLSNDEHGIFDTVWDLSNWAEDISRSIKPDNTYPGAFISMANKTFQIADGTVSKTPKMLNFNDFIGQPTWIGPLTVQFNCVMRADINIFDFVQFPQQQTTSTAAEQTLQAKDKSTFSGKFMVTSIRHTGRFRMPQGTAWITTFDAVAQQAAGSAAAAPS